MGIGKGSNQGMGMKVSYQSLIQVIIERTLVRKAASATCTDSKVHSYTTCQIKRFHHALRSRVSLDITVWKITN